MKTNESLPRNFPGGRLRRLRTEDAVAFQHYRGIAELARYQGWSVKTDTEALAFLDRMRRAPLFTAGEWVQLGIAEAQTDVLVGDIGLYLSVDGLTAEIGFTLKPSAQGRGIASAAVREALSLVFEHTPAERVLGITDSRNLASIRLLERVGFAYKEARSIVFRDEPCTEFVYEFPRREKP